MCTASVLLEKPFGSHTAYYRCCIFTVERIFEENGISNPCCFGFGCWLCAWLIGLPLLQDGSMIKSLWDSMRAIQLFEAIYRLIWLHVGKQRNNRLTVVATCGNDRNMLSLRDVLQTNRTNLKLGIRFCKFTFARTQWEHNHGSECKIVCTLLCVISIEDDAGDKFSIHCQYPLWRSWRTSNQPLNHLHATHSHRLSQAFAINLMSSIGERFLILSEGCANLCSNGKPTMGKLKQLTIWQCLIWPQEELCKLPILASCPFYVWLCWLLMHVYLCKAVCHLTGPSVIAISGIISGTA